LIEIEKKYSESKKEAYSHITFFKYNRIKKLYEDLSKDKINEFLST
jgi:hypothetical protein